MYQILIVNAKIRAAGELCSIGIRDGRIADIGGSLSGEALLYQ